MKTLTPFLIGFFIAGLEPFWPLGSPAIAFAAVLGVKYPGRIGLIAAVLAGLVRDVLLVNRLGTSSLLAAFAWLIAALGITRLDRPLVVSVAAAAIAGLPAIALAAAGFFPGPASYQFILSTAALAGIFSFVWNVISDRDDKIRVRKI